MKYNIIPVPNTIEEMHNLSDEIKEEINIAVAVVLGHSEKIKETSLVFTDIQIIKFEDPDILISGLYNNQLTFIARYMNNYKDNIDMLMATDKKEIHEYLIYAASNSSVNQIRICYTSGEKGKHAHKEMKIRKDISEEHVKLLFSHLSAVDRFPNEIMNKIFDTICPVGFLSEKLMGKVKNKITPQSPKATIIPGNDSVKN